LSNFVFDVDEKVDVDMHPMFKNIKKLQTIKTIFFIIKTSNMKHYHTPPRQNFVKS
jgi:hypothetical protein